MNNGWIKFHRQILDHPRSSDPNWFSLWGHLLLMATHQPIRMLFGGAIIDLRPGQLITSRRSLSFKIGIHRSTVDRLLQTMIFEQQIEQQTCNVSRLITILKWSDYQQIEPQVEQQASTKRAPNEQRASTNKKYKNIRTEEVQEGEESAPLALFPLDAQIRSTPKNPSPELKSRAVMLLTFLNEKAGRRFEARIEMLKPIMKRLMEGNVEGDIQKMIDREITIQGKASKWLQPSTLFGKNFYGSFADRELPLPNGNPNFLPKPDHRAEKASREFEEKLTPKILKP